MLAAVMTETLNHAWARFLAADTDKERRSVAMAHPIISEANDALEDLSRDPKAQALARWREDQLKLYRVELATLERQARQEGRQQGREEGLEQGLRSARGMLGVLCQALSIEVTEEREAQINGATLDEIDRLRDALMTTRSWPD